MKSLYYFLTFYLLPIIFGCKQKSLLEIQDLKFANIEKNAIALNQIDTTYLISDFKLFGYGKTDTFGYNAYDLSGNLIMEWRNGGWGYDIEFTYDSNDLVIYKAYDTDFLRQFNITYKFISDSLLLYQYWSAGAPYCLFYFNEKGILVNSLQYTYDDGNGSSETRSVYNYDNSGKLIEKIDSGYDHRIYEMKFRRIFHGNEISSSNITKYFYTDKKLDSLITTYYIQDNPKNNYTSKTYFNESGLRYKTILMDTIITTYLHKSRGL